ncbi:MAG: isocitrate lyase/phosphoenolpyruvate mutase family protein [Alphaproteobacteria bacterium]|nr:isocitrate lyase/phosphoenolpyruvate mutase family protein [Alphaproteobacteria bacterium]
MTALKDKARRFSDMHKAPGIVVLPNAWDIGSAVIMADLGFPAIATTSAGIAFSQGFPDGERISKEKMLEICAGIAAAVPVPVTADLEAGYGPKPEDVARTVQDAIDGGFVGCNIEDALSRGDGKLYDFEEACDRIRAGAEVVKKARLSFVLNARTDCYLAKIGDAQTTLAESIRRSNAYLAAGATCAFVPGRLDAPTITRLAHEIDGPLNVLGAIAGRPSPFAVAELESFGVKRVSIGGSLAGSALGLVRRAMTELKASGTFSYPEDGIPNAESGKLYAKYAPRK